MINRERTTTDGYVRVNGLRFHCRTTGPPGSAQVVVLHGIMGHSREWDTLVQTVSQDFRVMAVDQRGHGQTDWASEYTATAMADDVAGLVEVSATPPVHLIGHSMGAMAAALCAADRPELIGRLVLIDIGPDSLTSEWAAELPSTLEAFADASYLDVDQALREWLESDPLAREPLLRHYAEHNLVPGHDGRLKWRFDAAGLVRFATDGVTEEQLWNAISRISAPTLLIRGEHSELLSRPTAHQVVRRLERGELIEIAGAGHDLGVQQPEAVAAAISRFLAVPSTRST